mgnify:CR=1 FL=1
MKGLILAIDINLTQGLLIKVSTLIVFYKHFSVLFPLIVGLLNDHALRHYKIYSDAFLIGENPI